MASGLTRSEAQKLRRAREREQRRPAVWPNCACGCGQPAPEKFGLPLTFIHNHHRQKSPVQWIEDPNGCWLWQRSISQDGYATNGRPGGRVHNQMYRAKYGHPPINTELHHTCRVRHCVNPDHLTPVSRLEHKRLHPRKEKAKC